jgi:hypothetical protein
MRFWPKRRKGADAPTAPPGTDATLVRMVRTPETQRAIDAARQAAVELHEARRVRAKIDQRADAIDAETSKNGFVPLIARAFGSGS